ncbi:hypothetical protein EHM76_01380 [bacterium]|nr:MAG: hypothetical protein EHM76_01380 [bacterium]
MSQARSSQDRPMPKEKGYPSHSKENNNGTSVSEREAAGLKKTNPDKGPQMLEGQHFFDKGYDSDSEVFKRSSSYPGNEQRGNEYVKNNREIITRDSKKLERSQFSKIH